MPSLDETRLRLKNAELRRSLRDVLAMTRGPRGSADVEILRRACRLADEEPASEQLIAGARVESGASAERKTG